MLDYIIEGTLGLLVFFTLFQVVFGSYEDLQEQLTDEPEITAILLLVIIMFPVGVALAVHNKATKA